MGGKGVSYVSGTERSTVAVSPTTNLDTFSVQDKTQDKFYGVHPILPITAFTEKYLEEIIANDRKCALYIKDKVEFVLIKLAALRVQRLVITMIHGEHNQINILSLDKSITNINAICCNLAHEHTLSSTDSYTLWPIDQHEYLTPTYQ